ncbi:TRAP transporter small permease subunit [Rubidibacter lacunae]|nr:TRAP transporter small permease subunit [Rubidibacter lacunae]
MQILLRLSRWIDRTSVWVGRFTFGLMLVMVALGAYNAIARYLGNFNNINLSSNLYIEAQWYLFSSIFLLGASYVLQRGAHVRVDVFYSHLSAKGKAWVDLLGACLLLLPVCVVMFWFSLPYVLNSWKVLEASSDPNGLPRYPLKTAILVGLALLALQGISEIIKQAAILLDAVSDDASDREART